MHFPVSHSPHLTRAVGNYWAKLHRALLCCTAHRSGECFQRFSFALCSHHRLRTARDSPAQVILGCPETSPAVNPYCPTLLDSRPMRPKLRQPSGMSRPRWQVSRIFVGLSRDPTASLPMLSQQFVDSGLALCTNVQSADCQLSMVGNMQAP